MPIDHNIKLDLAGKYALVKLHHLPGDPQTPQELAAAILEHPEAVVFGTGDNEFFPLMLRDFYATGALLGYGYAVAGDPQGDQQFGSEVLGLAHRSGRYHPRCKRPD